MFTCETDAVITRYNNIKDLVEKSIISKFKNVVEISESTLIVTCNNILKSLPLYSKRDLVDLIYNMNKEYYNIKSSELINYFCV
jgi:hypothetical protein